MGKGILRNIVDSTNQSGFAVARAAIPDCLVDEFCRLTQSLSGVHQSVRRASSVYGIRHLLMSVPRLRELASSSPLIDLARAILGVDARPVKGTFFDKTSDANWPVPWHQDVTITIEPSGEVPGFDMRPVKDGMVHAIPPAEISQNMVALRIHLDDAGVNHGALRVIPGSHREGRLSQDRVNDLLANSAETVVAVCRADVMLMRPLLLHASSACQTPGHRRVIHLEYADRDLPGGLKWAG